MRKCAVNNIFFVSTTNEIYDHCFISTCTMPDEKRAKQ